MLTRQWLKRQRLGAFCRDFSQWLCPHICDHCQKPSQKWGLQGICLPCWTLLLQAPPIIYLTPKVRLISCGPYRGFWRKHLIQAKFKQSVFSYHILQTILLLTLVHNRALVHADILISIPTSPWRSLARGGNIIEHFSQLMQSHLELPHLPVALQKARWVKRQSKIGDKKSRRHNIRGAFSADPVVAGKDIFLFDDVCTSGATLKEAIRTLHQHRPKSITCLCLLRSPLEVLPALR